MKKHNFILRNYGVTLHTLECNKIINIKSQHYLIVDNGYN